MTITQYPKHILEFYVSEIDYREHMVSVVDILKVNILLSLTFHKIVHL